MRQTSLALALLLISTSAFALTYTVEADGSGDFATIQEALNNIESGDTILLGDGTYTGPGNVDLLTETDELTIRSASNDPNLCRIDCQGAPGNPHFGLRFDGQSWDSVLQGITFTGGYADVAGGALRLPDASPKIINCVFETNTAYNFGGAIYATNYSEPLIQNCRFDGNFADYYGQGGAIFADSGAAPTVEDCTFTSNIASDGSAIFGNLEADIVVRRSTFWNNGNNGHKVITIGEDSQALIENSILAFNTGYAVSCFGNGLIWVQCSNIYGNTNGNWTGCITGLDGIMGNMEVNPLMCNPAGGDYTLHADSPCAPANSGSCGLIGAWPVGCWNSITVAADGSGDYPTIQDAIDAAVGDGTEVIQLFDGIYLGPGNRDIDLLGKTLIIRSLSQNAAACIIDVEGDSADPHRAFWVRNGETAATTISHLTIRGGLTFLSSGMSYPGYGAGILISDGSSLTARNLIFEGNDAFESGSAIYIHGAASHLDISNSSFTGHTRIHSSTISTYYGCGLVMDNCQIDDSNTYGIILNGYQTGVTISNCDLSPVASPTKAAIHVSYVDDSPILIENCTLQSDTGHPLIDISYSSDVTVNGCTLTWETLDPSYWDFVSVGFSTATFDDCQFINNGPVDDTNEAMYISHSDVSLNQCSFSGFSSLTIRGIIAAFNSLLLVDTCSFTGNSDGIYYKGPEDLGLTVINSTFDGQAEWCIDAINTVAPVRVADSDFMNSGQGVRFLDSADCLIEDSNFIGNLANRTVTFSNSTGIVRRNQFEGNSASSDGGALYLLGSTVAVDSCGFTNNSSTGGGGAIACYTGEVAVSHSNFTGNDCDGAGGALYGTNADLQVMDCRFLGNQANQGGAIHGEFSTVYVEDSDFTDNTAAYAGGISAYQCDTNILTSKITGNEGTTRYGGIFLNQCASAIVDFCLITDNHTIDRGSAVTAWACDPTISSCTIVGNGGSPGTDAQVYFEGTCAPNLSRNIIAYGAQGPAVDTNAPEYFSPSISCSDIVGNAGGDWIGPLAGLDALNDNFSADPLFCDMAGDDYTLYDISPCLSSSSGCGSLVGAYDLGCSYDPTATSDILPSAVALLANHPNPFNPRTEIRFELPTAATVDLCIYDSAGRRVRNLIAGARYKAGSHGATWKGRDDAGRELPSGIYFTRFEAAGERQSGKLTLIR